MSQDYLRSIAERPLTRPARRVFWAVLTIAIAIGSAAAWYYAAAELTLSHYDARAHLVVSRRVFDNLTPGWRQLGSVWLPLPHLLNILPSAWDWSYRTGFLSVAISVLSLGAGLAALSQRIVLRTGSVIAAFAMPLATLANPNVLYLQSTPMTEPLFFGVALLAVSTVDAWIEAPSTNTASKAAISLAGLVLTRYEGWLIAGALVALAVVLRPRNIAAARRLWLAPASAIGAFTVLSHAATGQWPLSESFFVPDPELLHRPLVVIEKMRSGFLDLAGWPVAIAGAAGAAVLIARLRTRPEQFVFAAPVASVALPFLAFYSGHPYRVRYLVPLVVASAVLAALAIGSLPRWIRAVAGMVLIVGAIWVRPPFDSSAPMVVEAQWESPFRLERQRVSDVLIARDDGSPILASMGSLAHYMHEASRSGLSLTRFLHEGNGDLWAEALRSPRRSVGWVLIEERAEGGDFLAARARESASFLDGFDRVIEAGGLALYKRREDR